MNKFFSLLIIFIANIVFAFGINGQTIHEEKIFSDTISEVQKGKVDANSFKIDNKTKNYVYLKYFPSLNKFVMYSKNSVSEKFDFIFFDAVKFDLQGNYYAVGGNTIDTNYNQKYYLIVNGKVVAEYNYVDSYSSYINDKNEYVFISEIDSVYKVRRYNILSGITESKGYNFIKPAYNSASTAGEHENPEEYYLNDKNGRKIFIGLNNAGAEIIFDEKIISTKYSDINELSFVYDKKNNLTFIAKRNGRFYTTRGREFVVQGNKEYNEFNSLQPNIIFNKKNQPIYISEDSLSENIYSSNLIVGNSVQNILYEGDKKPPIFTGGITDIVVNEDGLSYFGHITDDSLVSDGEYEYYNYRTLIIKNDIIEKTFYNAKKRISNKQKECLFSAMKDLKVNKFYLYYYNGEDFKIISKEPFDYLYEYGFLNNDKIYYIGGNNIVENEMEQSVFIDGKLIGKYEYIYPQEDGDKFTYIKYNEKGDYAFVVQELNSKIQDNYDYTSYIITNKGKIEPKFIFATNKKGFDFIENLTYLKSGQLFYIAGIFESDRYTPQMQLMIDSKALGIIYSSIAYLKYNEVKNSINFIGTKGSEIFEVNIQF